MPLFLRPRPPGSRDETGDAPLINGGSCVGWRSMDRLLALALRPFIRRGNLRITTARGTTYQFGDGSGKPVAVRFTKPSAVRRILLDPELRLGEAYMDGSLVVEQGSIADLLGILLGQNPTGAPPPFAQPQWMLRYLRRRLQQFNKPRKA